MQMQLQQNQNQKQKLKQQSQTQHIIQAQKIFTHSEGQPCKPFYIINKKTGCTLTHGSEVSCRQLINTSVKQLWTAERMNYNGEQLFAIISFGTGTALTCSNGGNSFSCQKFRNRYNQLWKFQFACQVEERLDGGSSFSSDGIKKMVVKSERSEEQYLENVCKNLRFRQKLQQNKESNFDKKSIESNNANQQRQYYWIMNLSSANTEQECMFSNAVNTTVVKLSKSDRTLSTSLWRIQEVDENDRDYGFSEIRSVASKMVIQAPIGAISQEPTELFQSKKYGKGTQKWIIQKFFDKFVIRGLCSGLVMTVTSEESVGSAKEGMSKFPLFNMLGGSYKNCQKVFQSVFDNTLQQKWNLIKTSGNSFYFQSATDSDKFLASLTNKDKDYLYLVGSENFGKQNKNIEWTIKGALPQSLINDDSPKIIPYIKKKK